MKENFEELLNSSFKTLNTGEIVTGTVTAVTDAELQLDIGAPVTGIIKAEQITDDPSVKLTDLYKMDVIICNHLLEHVENDVRAMSELYRVMRPGGWGIMVVPEDRGRATTFEDDSITDPEERTRLFGQYDHRRVYGRDYDDRLRAAGFEVCRTPFAESLTAEERRMYCVGGDDLVVVKRVK